MRIAGDGTIMYANAAAGPLLEEERTRVGELAPHLWRLRISRALEAESIERLELSRGGRTVSLELAPVPLAGYVNCYGRDITDRRRAEEAAQEAQARLLSEQRARRQRAEAELAKIREELVRTTRLAAIGQVSASIAHDLRNPLASIRNAVYYLKRKGIRDRALLQEYLGIIDEEIETANATITGLLSIAKAESTEKQNVDFGRLVTGVLARDPKGPLFRCEVSLDPDPFMVFGAPGQLRQVIRNLLDNASDAMGSQGEMFVEARRDGRTDTIVFRDSGPGVADEVRDKLFEPLVTSKAKGTGLGLTICRQIVERHGGAIDFVAPGAGGAAFRVRLPRGGDEPSERRTAE